MVALAVAWFLVFMPSSGKSRMQQIDRVVLRRRTVVGVGVGLVVAGVAAYFAGQGLIVAVGFGAVLLGFGVVFGVRQLRIRRSLPATTRRRQVPTGLTADQAEPEPEIEYTNPRAWTAGQVPSQTLRPKYAKLETPTLADVVDLPKPQELKSETLDEIMRRRRAN